MRSAKMAQSKSRHYVSLFVSMVLFVGSLNAECCTDGETKVDADDCTKYLACCHGEFVSKSCKDGYYWNSDQKDCVVDNGECKPPTCVEGSITANPDDCAGFLECVDGTVVVVSCPEGDYFNATQNSCVPDTCGVCINCTEGSKKEDLSDCAKFQICVNGKYVSKSCPTGDYWNSADKECQKDEGQCNGSPGCTEGELEVDPTDCAGYWKCTNGSLVSVKCPDGAYFNATYKTCVPDTDGVCVNCTEGAQKPEPSDCTKYQVCSGGKYVTKSCEGGYYWNNKTEVCEWDNGQCNGNGTTCTDGEVKVDPTDCAGYLSCSNGSYVNVKCADGAYFNATLETCVPDTEGVCVKCTEGAIKENPADCSGYLQCVNGNYVARKCSATQFFNTTLQRCVVDTEGVCIPKTCDPDCCDVPNNSIWPVEKNCSAFYQCVDGNKYQQRCSNNLQYNSETEQCDYPENVNCDDGSAPPSGPNAGPSGTYCESHGRCVGQRDGTMFADASGTCSSAYVVCQCECEVNFSCSSGLMFNKQVDSCDWPANVKC